MNINFIAAFVTSFLGLILGYFWYSLLFAKPWQKLAGVTDNQMNQGVAKRIIGSYLITLVMMLNLSAFIGSNDASFGLFAGFATGFGWVAMAFGTNYLFEHRPFKLLLINAGYNILLFTIAGYIIGLM